MSVFTKGFIASAAALGLAASAFAQDRPPMPAGGPDGPGGAHAFMDHMKERMEARQTERIKALHDVLAIRADQEPAFQAFTAALHPGHDGAKGARGPRPGADGGPPQAAMPSTTPERLDHMVARMQERQQHMEARVTAIKTFYAALSPDQRHTFDSLSLLRGGDMMGHEGGMMRRGDGPHA